MSEQEQTNFKFEAKTVDENGLETSMSKTYDPQFFDSQPVIFDVVTDFKNFLVLSGYTPETIKEAFESVINEEL